MQVKLPLDNDLLQLLECLNPQKRENKSTLLSIQGFTKVLQPILNVTEVVDEWKVFQVENDLPGYNPKERIELFWNTIFQLQSADGDLRYKLQPVVIKSALLLGQTIAESECSLFVNARIVAQEKASIGEKKLLAFMSLKMLSGSMIQFLTE